MFIDSDGYPREANKNFPSGMKLHRAIAERALGHTLPPKAQVHHVDGNRLNYENSNLVICEDNAYHCLLHVRQRTLDLGEDPNTHKPCCYCGKAVAKELFYPDKGSGDGFGRACKPCARAKSNDHYRQKKRSLVV